ncbi:uncharacterized protein LOC134273296, partial [Saccostrea cucullata]|uniref:uncharacterized protein LOC134273296 n=1 Tax=Saccostrea cuccullata TaxID=36930 RepID=UPI002ED47EE4
KMFQFYEDDPSKIKFLRLTERIRESLKECDLPIMKHHLLCLNLPRYGIEESAKILNLLDIFSFPLSHNYFSSSDVVFMQLLLRCLGREDLEEMCIQYATEESEALCYYAERTKTENGCTHVQFHISKNINSYPRKNAERLRETVAELVECPKHSIILDGILRSSSFNLVFQMKREYVSKLINMQPQKLAVLGRYAVDKIIVGQQTIPIDSNETCTDMCLSDFVYIGLCREVGSPTEVRIRREVMDTEEVLKRPVNILRGFDRMTSGSKGEGFRLITSDEDWMFWPPDHKVICDLSQINLYRIPQHIVILMECDDGMPPGFTRLNLMSPSNNAKIFSSCVVMNNTVYISSTLFRDNQLQLFKTISVSDTSVFPHGPCSTQSIDT